MTDLKNIDLDQVHLDYMKNIDQEEFWEGELIHVHQKNSSFTTATVLGVQKNNQTEMTSVKVRFDSGRTINVDLKECQKLVLTGPRQLRRRSSQNSERSESSERSEMAKFPKTTKNYNSAKVDTDKVRRVSDPRMKNSPPGILKRKGDFVQKPSQMLMPKNTISSPFFTNKTTDFATAVSQTYPDVNKNKKPAKVPKNKMNLTEYQTESSIKSVAKSMDQDEKIEKLSADNKKLRTKIAKVEKESKENKQTMISEIEELRRYDSVKTEKLSRAHAKELRKQKELWEIEKENHEKIVKNLNEKMSEKNAELENVRKTAVGDGEQLVISSLKGIQDRLKPARKRRKEIMRGVKPFEKEFFGENNLESYVTATQDIEFGNAGEDLKRQLYLESLQNQNFIYKYVNESLAKCNK
jgi:hypothetical protein